MGNIVILDENTSNKIAAGEVVERPASIVKELVENSIDAGAGNITVEIKNGGISFIKVTDNGLGIDEDDVEIAFERHATSKIRNSDDLDSISTLGFRGEALASIASVSKVQLTTRVQRNSYGMYLEVHGGLIKDVRQTGCPVGTTFVIRDLFYNTPARFKFLKKDSTEAGYISDILNRIALGNPHISFRLLNNGSTIVHTPGNNDLLSAIFSIYGKDIANNVYEVNYCDQNVKIKGYAGKPEISRSNRNHQSIYINGRYIKSKVITSAIDEAYKTFLMKNKFAFVVLDVQINPLFVDVNVHPTKMEVRFSNEQEIFRSIYHAVNNAILNKADIRTVKLDEKNKDYFKLNKSTLPEIKYTQQSLIADKDTGVREEPSNIEFTNNSQKNDLPVNKLIKTEINDEKIYKKIPESQQTIQYKNVVPVNGLPVEENSNEQFLSYAKLVGQIFSTYIVLEDNDNMMLIDQHAAHERLMFEKLKKKFHNNESLSQLLLTPVVIEVTHQELKFLENEKIFFDKLGFIYENFGNNSIILRAIPYIDNGINVKQTFMEVVDHLMNSWNSNFNIIAEDALYTIACKAAVKANNKLDAMEIEYIMKELARIENPYTCPHGRPTIIKISKYELEKKFKRIV